MPRSLLLLLAIVVIGYTVIAQRVERTVIPRVERPARDINLTMIRRVFCAKPGSEDGGVGTAWMIGKDVFVTAAHVAEKGMECFDVDTNATLKIVYTDPASDFAMLKAPTTKQTEYIEYSCEGFANFERYVATGWADGDTFKQTHLISSDGVTSSSSRIDGKLSGGLRFLEGTVYNGMSGGPIFDDHGVAVGINTASNNHGITFARDLRDTALCVKN